MQKNQHGATDIRLAELMAALSLATDLGMGQPMEFALCTCVLAVRLGETLGLSESELREIYYLALLRHIGCNVDAHLIAAFMGDEIAMRANFIDADFADPTEMMGIMLRHFRQMDEGATPFHFARMVVQGLWGMRQVMKEGATAVCEVAQRLAERLGFTDGFQQAPGLEGVKQAFGMFSTAFPDFHITIEDQIAEGDLVASQVIMRGTHQGEFFGIPPTGRQISISGIHIHRIAGGKVREHWGNNDDLGLMQQLGVIPPMG